MRPHPIARIVRRELAARKMPQTQLADLCDVHRNVLGRFLAGSRAMRLDQVERVLAKLGLRLTVTDRRGRRVE